MGGVSGSVGRILSLMFSPSIDSGVAEFYALWFTVFLAINIIWDIFTPRTDPFHLSHLSDKVDTLFSSTTFSSSLYLMLTVFQSETTALAGSSKVPLIISAFSGVLISIKYLCPYEIPARKKAAALSGSPAGPSVSLP